MKGVILDRASFDTGDLNLEPLQACLKAWQIYDETLAGQTAYRIDDAEVVITNKVAITQNIVAHCPNLKLVLLAATGSDNVDLQACQQHNITVCNVRDYSTSAVMQHTIAMMLALTTRLIDYHHDVKHGKWQQNQVFCLLDYPIFEVTGKTLGIIGYGHIGQAVTKVAKCLGMQVMIAQRPGVVTSPPNGRIKLHELLPQVDVLSIHCPLTADTYHLIGRDELSLMKKTALLLNTARGAIVDQGALADALSNGDIAGAGIDVLSQEPPHQGNPLLDITQANLIVTPHTAWASVEARSRLIIELTKNLEAWLRGSPINML